MFRLSVENGLATINIDRGQSRNAIPLKGWAELGRLFGAANTNDVRAILLRSSDPDNFCAGADLRELESLAKDADARRKFRGAMASVFDRIRNSNKPTVALIRGGCFGVGVSLATACDLRIVRSDSAFAITSARFGMSYPQRDLERLIDLVGRGQAARLVYGCGEISGVEAVRIGLAEVVDDGDDMGADLIKGILASAPSSLCALKATLLGRFGADDRFDASFASSDFAAGIAAFHGRRVPAY